MRERKLFYIQHIFNDKKTFTRTNRYVYDSYRSLGCWRNIGCINYTEDCLVSKQRQTFTFLIRIPHNYVNINIIIGRCLLVYVKCMAETHCSITSVYIYEVRQTYSSPQAWRYHCLPQGYKTSQINSSSFIQQFWSFKDLCMNNYAVWNFHLMHIGDLQLP